jgi:hypothetical protein
VPFQRVTSLQMRKFGLRAHAGLADAFIKLSSIR